jgi:hypothetical protein
MKRKRRSHAERQRRYCARQANGDCVVKGAWTQAETAKLHRLGYLDGHAIEDRTAIEAALHLMLASIHEDV